MYKADVTWHISWSSFKTSILVFFLFLNNTLCVKPNCLDYFLRLDSNVADVRRTVSVATGGAGSDVRPPAAVASRPDGPTATLSCPSSPPPPPRLDA